MMIKGLDKALAAEAAARANRDGILQRIELAKRDKFSALGKRDAAMAAFAAGGPQGAVVKIDVEIRTAEAALMMLNEAAAIAEGRVSESERDVESLLRQELAHRVSLAATKLAEAEAAFEAALNARDAADRALGTANRAVRLPTSHLRGFFVNEITKAEAAVHG